MKKGEMSIAVIIAAAIALLILVILAVLILRSGTGVTTGTGCAGTGGQCIDSDGETGCGDLEGTYIHDLTKDGKKGNCQESQICCIPILRGDTQ